jgi:serine/threonine-protein kinase
MSPEQASGHPVDYRSDLFSLGSSIYFMCTGRPPFRAEHALAILNRVCNDEHRPVDEVNSDVPAELADVIDRLLAKNPDDRFRNAHEVEQRLEAILVGVHSGRRSLRLRWRRNWRRNKSLAKKFVATSCIAAACVAAGTQLTGPSSTKPEEPKLVTPAATTDARHSESVVFLPVDTFQHDISEVQRLLKGMEVPFDWNINPDSPQYEWGENLSSVRTLLDQLESQ